MPSRKARSGPSRRALLGGAAALAWVPRPAFSQAAPGAAQAETIWTAGPGKTRLKPEPAKETPIWCFDGKSAPPVLRIKHGESVRLKLDNKTEKPLSLHWHGVRNQNAMDGVGGVTQPPIAPGASFTYAFTPPDAGTSVIRPLVVGGSSEPSGRGLAGLLVVEEKTPPAVDRDLSFLLQDVRLEEDGQPLPFGQVSFAAASGRLGNLVTLNGRPIPDAVEVPPGSRLRLRIANACNARTTRIRFDGAKAYVVAVDGQPTDTFEPLRATLPFAPGTRYDLLLDMPAEAGAAVTINALIGSGLALATITANGAPLTQKRPEIKGIGNNTLLPAEVRLQNAFRRDLVLTGGAKIDTNKPGVEPAFTGDPTRIWQVNGVSGTAGAAPAFSVKRGQVVVLTVRNDTSFLQTLHVHGHAFRLLHPLDDGWEPYWLDTFQLLDGKLARIAFLADNPGRWLISSTVLERFDTGLWTSFDVS
ncbi:multicopper oxidase family protein [Methylobacterium haplocladii]|uniref:Metallo-oxidoreductase n=1 Tax=Methylobacterium haplocladii TaxID=1176176 RepID=A0A512IR63_9HYPH|nr:multicopper oxidase family protein [Methylobacterium haplocladii]GEP00205.1 metallo-oxidoreductase [Methylobacterium haplocladii]GJD83739.1 Cell division protein FtsP [Methylobacterium haplocladii]GLS57949.1 metallo-oxidoreductase [Methylobacterium haplocladii]